MAEKAFRAGSLALLGAAAVVTVLATVACYGYTREYGDVRSSGWLNGLLTGLVGLALTAPLAFLAASSARRSRTIRIAAILFAVIGLAGPVAAGPPAMRAKAASMPRTPRCMFDEPGVAVDPLARAHMRTAQEVFDSLHHPGPFTGGTEAGIGGCADTLATVDLATAIDFYRDQIAAPRWTISSSSAGHLEARRDDGLSLVVSAAEGGTVPEVRVTPTPGAGGSAVGSPAS